MSNKCCSCSCGSSVVYTPRAVYPYWEGLRGAVSASKVKRSSCGCNCGSSSKPSKPNSSNITVKWTGENPYPWLGEWKIFKDGKDVTQFLPTHMRTKPMCTYGEYPIWPLPQLGGVWEYAVDGWLMPEWIHRNHWWLRMLCDYDQDYVDIYRAFQAQDFRVRPGCYCVIP